MTTGARGEGILQLDDGEVRVLFTNRALAEIEQKLALKLKLLSGESAISEFLLGLGVGDTAQVLQVGMEAARHDARAGGRSTTLSDAYRVLDEVGIVQVSTVLVEAIAAVLTFGVNSEEADENPPE
jgi:hypothetical protein